MTTADVVAIKIIDVDESDMADPRNADSYSEFLKEVNALKLLRDNKARNINHVIEALSVGNTMWIITDYCRGGSVATLVCLSPRFLICDVILLQELTKLDETYRSGWPSREMDHSNPSRSSRSYQMGPRGRYYTS